MLKKEYERKLPARGDSVRIISYSISNVNMKNNILCKKYFSKHYILCLSVTNGNIGNKGGKDFLVVQNGVFRWGSKAGEDYRVPIHEALQI